MLKTPSISLATVLEGHKLDNDYQLKTLLSYLIAKAVWLYYDTTWMAQRWTKYSIHFMLEREGGQKEPREVLTLIQRPFIAVKLNHSSDQEASASRDNEESPSQVLPTVRLRYPRILDLAVMLLEIELGHTIDGFFGNESLDHKGRVIPNSDYFTASAILMREDWKRRNAYYAVKEIIEICVKGDKGQLGNDHTFVRNKLHTFVVAPLRRLFQEAWSPDHDPESFPIQPIIFKKTELLSQDASQVRLEGASESSFQRLQAGFSAPSNGSPTRGTEDHDPYVKR